MGERTGNEMNEGGKANMLTGERIQRAGHADEWMGAGTLGGRADGSK